MKRKINTKKLRDEIFGLVTFVLGIIALTLNFFKIVPGLETPLEIAITTVIAYLGFPVGIFFIVGGIFIFSEARNRKNSRKKTRR